MIAEVEAQKPVLFALGRFKLRKFSSRANFKLLDQMTGQYIALKRCPALLSGLYMVRSDRADQRSYFNARPQIGHQHHENR